jgi:hypothetical protein
MQIKTAKRRLRLPTNCRLTDWLTAKLLLVLSSTVILGSLSHGTNCHILISDVSVRLQTLTNDWLTDWLTDWLLKYCWPLDTIVIPGSEYHGTHDHILLSKRAFSFGPLALQNWLPGALRCIALARTTIKTPLPKFLYCWVFSLPRTRVCTHCLVMATSIPSTIPVFSLHIVVYFFKSL